MTFTRICCLAALGLTGRAHAQAGLTKIDINNPIAGIVTANPDSSTTVTAGGGDTYGTADSFTYLYGQKSGNFDVKVKVLNVDADDPATQQRSAKASLHVRANLTAGSPDIQVSGTPSAGEGYVETIARAMQDGETNDPPPSAPDFRYFEDGPYPGTFKPDGGGALYPIWLRVKRTGNLFQTMCSKDNIRWTVLAEYSMDPASFPNTLYVGLGAVAHIDGSENAANRVRSTFSDYGDVVQPPVANVDGTPVAPSNAPGTYPSGSVTSVNWQVSLPADGIGRTADNTQSGPIVWNTEGFGSISRDVLLSIDGQQGPIPFSIGRYATGAFDFGISPRDPLAAQSNLGPYTNPSRDRDTPAVTDPASQAWFPSPRHGIVIPTVRVNGTVQWNDGAAPFYPHAYEALDFSSAQYFSMDDGTFGNGLFYTRMAKRGDTDEHPNPDVDSAGGFQRAACDVSTAWFPYADGWMSGSFSQSVAADGGAFWRSPGTHSAAATQGTLSLNPNSAGALLSWTQQVYEGGSFYGGLATLSLPGIDSRDDGMLFLVPNDDTSSRGPQANCSVKPDGSGWNVAIRSVANISEPQAYMPSGNDEFSFLHVPYTALNVIGGKIAGATGAKVNSAGDFSVTRTAAGRYQITIPGETGETGMLILQAVGEFPGEPTGLVDNASLSYQYENGAFVVESRELDPFGAPNGFASATLRDSDFYFAWVDFANPLSAGDPTLPPLSILRNGSTITLSWPVEATGYTLETSANLANPWTDVPGVVNNSVTLPLTPAVMKQFFRLRSAP